MRITTVVLSCHNVHDIIAEVREREVVCFIKIGVERIFWPWSRLDEGVPGRGGMVVCVRMRMPSGDLAIRLDIGA